MNRTLFFREVTVEGINELDFLDYDLSGLVLKRPTMYYRVGQGDLHGVPDNIAFKLYKDERLWWVICLVNGIANPCADIYVGQLLKVPDILDIYDFFRKYRRR